MQNFIDQLLGQHLLSVWSAGLIWCIIGISLVKAYFFDRKKNNKLKFYLNDNAQDVILGIIICLILLRLGDYAFNVAEHLGYTLGDTTDFVAWMIPISCIVQYKLHKRRKPISNKIANQMHFHNENEKAQ